jgi:tight adherence protein B
MPPDLTLDPAQLAAIVTIAVVLLLGVLVPVAVRPGPRTRLRTRVDAIAGASGSRAASGAKGGGKSRKIVGDLREAVDGGAKKQRRARVKQLILQAGLSWKPGMFYSVSALMSGSSLAGYILAGLPLWAAPLAAFVGFVLLPRLLLKRLAGKRQKKFTLQLADGIDVIVRGIRSGLPVGECLNIIARESPEPIGGEFKMIVEGQRLGLTLKDVLDRAIERMPTADMRFFAVVLVLQQKTGGNLAEALANLSSILRARKKMADKVKAMSAEARMTASIIGSLPFILASVIWLLNPGYIELLFVDPTGKKMAIGGLIWMAIGVFIMKQMVSFRV